MPKKDKYVSNVVRKPMPPQPDAVVKDNILPLEDYVPPAKGIGVRQGKGNFSVVKMGQPKGIGSPDTVAGINAAQRPGTVAQEEPSATAPEGPAGESPFAGIKRPGGINDNEIYTSAIERLQKLGKGIGARRDWVTPFGDTINIVDRSAELRFKADKAIVDLVRGVYGEDVGKAKGEAAYKLGIGADLTDRQKVKAARERTGVLEKGQEQAGRGLLQKAILGEQDRKSKAQSGFLKQLELYSPKVGDSSNVEIGLFRMMESGAEMPNEYKPQAKRLLADFEKTYKQFLTENGLEDMSENRRTAKLMYEEDLAEATL